MGGGLGSGHCGGFAKMSGQHWGSLSGTQEGCIRGEDLGLVQGGGNEHLK